jgi:ABC-type proline/glycine betaine transport system permease subunit
VHLGEFEARVWLWHDMRVRLQCFLDHIMVERNTGTTIPSVAIFDLLISDMWATLPGYTFFSTKLLPMLVGNDRSLVVKQSECQLKMEWSATLVQIVHQICMHILSSFH